MMKHKIILFFLLFISIISFSQKIDGYIKKVYDGDTFILIYHGLDIKIRLADIDAPEKKQQYGIESTEFLKQFEKKFVTVDIIKMGSYGRYIATLYVDSTDINRYMVKRGLAHCYKKSKKYIIEQEQAKSTKSGLWQYSNVILPYNYRKKK